MLVSASTATRDGREPHRLPHLALTFEHEKNVSFLRISDINLINAQPIQSPVRQPSALDIAHLRKGCRDIHRVDAMIAPVTTGVVADPRTEAALLRDDRSRHHEDLETTETDPRHATTGDLMATPIVRMIEVAVLRRHQEGTSRSAWTSPQVWASLALATTPTGEGPLGEAIVSDRIGDQTALDGSLRLTFQSDSFSRLTWLMYQKSDSYPLRTARTSSEA